MVRHYPPLVARRALVSVDREGILAATPRYFVRGMAPPFGIPHEDLPREVRSAIGELRWSAHHPDDLRILAYVNYVGALNEEELRSRLTASDEDLSGDAADICSAAAAAISDAEIAAAIQSLFRDQSDPWRPARSPAEGWAITVLELINAVRPNVLPLVLRRDASRRIVLVWLLRKGSLGENLRTTAVSVLMESSDQRDWDAAAAFLSDAARDHILRNEPAPSVPSSGSAHAQLIVSGLMLSEIFNFGRSRSRPLDPEAANRWQQLVRTMQGAVAAATATASDARKLLQSLGKEDTTLIPLILGSASSASYRTLAEAGDSVIREYFRPVVKSEEQAERKRLPYLGPLIVNDLVNIWVQIGADEHFFSGLVDGLRCDEYAFEFTYSYYLTDRTRAMILAAIGAVAGVETKNEALRLAAINLSDNLRNLPEGVAAPFDEAGRSDLEKRTGIVVPAK
jgi:hypothetical protein